MYHSFLGAGGIYLARCPQAPKLDFRHSDNINVFFNFVRGVGLPEVSVVHRSCLESFLTASQSFIFELTDLYEKKNFPKVIYCIHALRYAYSILHAFD